MASLVNLIALVGLMTREYRALGDHSVDRHHKSARLVHQGIVSMIAAARDEAVNCDRVADVDSCEVLQRLQMRPEPTY